MALAIRTCAVPSAHSSHIRSYKLWSALQKPCRFNQRVYCGRRAHSTSSSVDTDPTTQEIPEISASYAKSRSPLPANLSLHSRSSRRPAHSPRYDPSRAPTSPGKAAGGPAGSQLSEHIRDALPLFAAQTPHYATIHIHGKPYLVTQGDTLRLPFLMHGVGPGDILRLNRVTRLGSRDWTLSTSERSLGFISTSQQIEKVHQPSHQSVVVNAQPLVEGVQKPNSVQHLNDLDKRTSKPQSFTEACKNENTAYLDERLYTLRAVVIGTESEPLRIKEKKKQRNRHTRTVKSKHRFTILRIKELGVAQDVRTDLEAV